MKPHYVTGVCGCDGLEKDDTVIPSAVFIPAVAARWCGTSSSWYTDQLLAFSTLTSPAQQKWSLKKHTANYKPGVC